MKRLVLMLAAAIATTASAEDAKPGPTVQVTTSPTPVAVPGAAATNKALKAATSGASRLSKVQTDVSKISDADKEALLDAKREKEEKKGQR